MLWKVCHYAMKLIHGVIHGVSFPHQYIMINSDGNHSNGHEELQHELAFTPSTYINEMDSLFHTEPVDSQCSHVCLNS
jgi:hypothetical protein